VRAAVRLLSRGVALAATAGRGGRRTIGPGFVSNGHLHLRGPGTIRIGARANAWTRAEDNFLTTLSLEAVIEVGDNVRLNGCDIQAAARVTVGDDCILGSCIIVDTDYHSVEPDRREPGAAVVTRPVSIGRNVWVGGKATVLKGVTIGDDSVVGYGAIVVADVPAGAVVAGNPAKVVRRLYETA
jgi:acetyltransferase-like isoleucine patch superfamily enzyme